MVLFTFRLNCLNTQTGTEIPVFPRVIISAITPSNQSVVVIDSTNRADFLALSLDNINAYNVVIQQDPVGWVFAQWPTTASTSRARAITVGQTSPALTYSAAFNPAGPNGSATTLQVNAQNAGNQSLITGLTMTLWNDSVSPPTFINQESPATFNIVTGNPYRVYANEFTGFTFLNWSDGLTTQERSVNVSGTGGHSLTAVYQVATAPPPPIAGAASVSATSDKVTVTGLADPVTFTVTAVTADNAPAPNVPVSAWVGGVAIGFLGNTNSAGQLVTTLNVPAPADVRFEVPTLAGIVSSNIIQIQLAGGPPPPPTGTTPTARMNDVSGNPLPASVAAGTAMYVDVTNFPASATANITVDGAQAGSFMTSATGTGGAQILGLTAGTHAIVVSSGTATASTSITVTGGTPPPPGGGPSTPGVPFAKNFEGLLQASPFIVVGAAALAAVAPKMGVIDRQNGRPAGSKNKKKKGTRADLEEYLRQAVRRKKR